MGQYKKLYECNNFIFDDLSVACNYASFLEKTTRIIHAVIEIN